MGAMTNYLESGLLSHLFKKTGIGTPPDVLYVGLLTDASNTDALEAGNGTLIALEPKTVVVSGNTSWSTPFESGSAMAVKNIIDISFPKASGNKGFTSGVAIYLNSESNMLFYGSLTNPREIRDGDQFVFPSGSLKITFN